MINKTTININELKNISEKILENCGVSKKDSRIVSDSIIYAHQAGQHAHGVTRIPIYVKKIKNGLMNPNAKMPKILDTGAVVVLDAENGLGQVAGVKGMRMAVDKAKKYGIGAVGVKNSNNFGTAGFIAGLATQKEMIGIVFANSSPAMAVWKGKKPILGTNPMAFAFPGSNNMQPIIFDMATTIVARGKIRSAVKLREKISPNWALDRYGNPTDDPIEALKGSMVPIGEHKGFGLSLVVDILAGLLTGAAFGGKVKQLNNFAGFSNNGHFIIAINIKVFMETSVYEKKIVELVKRLKKSAGTAQIHIPGHRNSSGFSRNNQKVILKKYFVDEINAVAKQLKIKKYLIYE